MDESQLSTPKSWKDAIYTIVLAIIVAIAQEFVRNPSKVSITISTYVIQRGSYTYPVEAIDYLFIFTLFILVLKLDKVLKNLYEHIYEIQEDVEKLKRGRWRRR